MSGIGSAPLAVPLDRGPRYSRIGILRTFANSRILYISRIPGIFAGTGSWVISASTPVLVPIPVVSLARLLKVPAEKLLSVRSPHRLGPGLSSGTSTESWSSTGSDVVTVAREG